MAADEDVGWDRPTTFSDNTKKRKWLLISAIIVLVVGLALIIAGSIMLGIGVSKSKTHCDHISAVPKYITVLTNTSITETLKNYNSVSQAIKDELTSTLSRPGSDAPVVTILGLSMASDGQRTNAFAGITYTSQNEMSDETIKSSITQAQNLQLNFLDDPKGTNEQTTPLCLMVNPVNDNIGSTTPTTQSSVTAATYGSTLPQSSTSGAFTSDASSSSILTTAQTECTTTPCFCPSSTTIRTSMSPTTTEQPVNPAYKDIFLLIDDSTAVGNAENYKSIITWIVNDLIAPWQVGSANWEVSPVLYARNEYRWLMDFDAEGVDAVKTILTQSTYGGSQPSNIALALKIASGFPSRPRVPRTYILISASSDSNDIAESKKYVDEITSQGGEVITLTVGGADSTYLGQLATQSAFSFNSSATFSPSKSIADEMNVVLIEEATTTVTSTTPATTTAESEATVSSSTAPDSTTSQSSSISTETVTYTTSVSSSPIGSTASTSQISSSTTANGLTTTQPSSVTTEAPSSTLSLSSSSVGSTASTRQISSSSTATILTTTQPSSVSTEAPSSTVSSSTLSVGSSTSTSQTPSSSIATTGTTTQPASSSTEPVSSSSSFAPTGTTVTYSTKTPVSCSRDVLMLVDESNAYGDSSNFDKVKYWLGHKLVPRFVLDATDLLASVYTFTNTTFSDTGADYAEQSTDELTRLIDSSLRYSKDVPGLTRALKKASQLGTARYAPTVLLISASDSSEDVSSALPFANTLKAQGGAFITVAVGNMLSGHLGKLSSGLSYSIVSTDYSISDEKTEEVVRAICSGLAVSTTNIPMTSPAAVDTTTEAITDFSCNPDVAILIDGSAQAQSEKDFQKVVSFIADTLVINWDISPTETEGLAMVGSADADSIMTENAYNVKSASDFSDAIQELGNHYIGGDTGLTNMLKTLENTLPSKRPTAPLTAIIFTHFTDPDDISSAKKMIDQIKGINVIAVGLGKSADSKLLYQLTGNVIKPLLMNSVLKQSIQKMICTVNPATIPPSTTQVSTEAITTTAASTTVLSTLPSISSTPSPICSDCYPDVSDVLILLDCSNANRDETFENQKQAVIQLTSNWNHLGRVSAACYSAELDQFVPYDTVNTIEELTALINVQKLHNSPPDLSKALHQANGITSTTGYGVQHTILFITKNDGPAILNAQPSGQELIKKGSVTSIAVGFDDLGNLKTLSSPNSAIQWKDTSDIASVVQAIMATIPHSNTPPTQASTLPSVSSTAEVSMSSTVNVQTSVAGLSTLPSISSTPSPICSDCYPDVSDVLILLDCSNANRDETFENQKQAVIQLTSNWNHLGRVSAACYSAELDQFVPYDTVNTIEELTALINLQIVHNSPPDLSKALHQANGIISTTGYGVQHTILFITKNDGPAILNAQPSGQELIRKGSVTSIAVGFDDLGNLKTLSSPNSAIQWKDTSDIASVVQAIMATIPHSNTPPTQASTLPSVSSTTGVSMSSTVNVQTSVESTIAPYTSTVGVVSSTPQSDTTHTVSASPTPDINYFNPPKANLMIVLDSSSNQDSKNFEQQKAAAKKLVSNWTHAERTTLGSFSNTFLETSGYGDVSSIDEITEYIGLLEQSDKASDIEKSLEQMNLIRPLPSYGSQTIILFVSVQNQTALKLSYPQANALSTKGGLIIIAVGSDDVKVLSSLSSSKRAIAWKNLDDIGSVVQSISQQISDEYAQPTASVITTTVGGFTDVISTTEALVTKESSPASTAEFSVKTSTVASTTQYPEGTSTVAPSTQNSERTSRPVFSTESPTTSSPLDRTTVNDLLTTSALHTDDI